jgi:DNA polymerase
MKKSDSGNKIKSKSPTRRAVTQLLRSAQQAGVTHVRKPPPRKATVAKSLAAGVPTSTRLPLAAAPSPKATLAAATPAVAARPAATLIASGTTRPAAKPLKRADRIAALSVLQQEVAGCRRCKELASTRTQTVFGVGNPEARLCFLGEAPGADEDRLGEPFVGRAGQLLTKIIEACKLRREDVYILNVLKCRPPGNRNPLPDEVTNCRGYLEAQLEIIRPEFICCLGAVAARMLLDTPAPIGKLRKQFFNYGHSQVLCTYHPAFLLRNPNAKKDVWEDMQLLMERLGMPIAKKK